MDTRLEFQRFIVTKMYKALHKKMNDYLNFAQHKNNDYTQFFKQLLCIGKKAFRVYATKSRRNNLVCEHLI